jgi:hypothetical protein
MNWKVVKADNLKVFKTWILGDGNIHTICNKAVDYNALTIIRYLYERYSHPKYWSHCFFKDKSMVFLADELGMRATRDEFEYLAQSSHGSQYAALDNSFKLYTSIVFASAKPDKYNFHCLFNACYCRQWSEVLKLLHVWQIPISFTFLVATVSDWSNWKQEDLFALLVTGGCFQTLKWGLQQDDPEFQERLLSGLPTARISEHNVAKTNDFCQLLIGSLCISSSWIVYLVFMDVSAGNLSFFLAVLEKFRLTFATFQTMMVEKDPRAVFLSWIKTEIGNIDVNKLQQLFELDSRLVHAIDSGMIQDECRRGYSKLFDIAHSKLKSEHLLTLCANAQLLPMCIKARSRHVLEILVQEFPECTVDLKYALRPVSTNYNIFTKAGAGGDVGWFKTVCGLFQTIFQQLFTPTLVSTLLESALTRNNCAFANFLIQKGCCVDSREFSVRDVKLMHFLYWQHQQTLVIGNLRLPKQLQRLVLEWIDYFAHGFRDWHTLDTDDWQTQSVTSVQILLS